MDGAVQDDVRGFGEGVPDRELNLVLVEALERNGAPPERLEQCLLFDTDAGAEDADHRWLRNHTDIRILMRLHTGRRLSHVGIQEQGTGEDRGDAGQDRKEGGAGVLGRAGLILVRGPGEGEVQSRGAAPHYSRCWPGAG